MAMIIGKRYRALQLDRGKVAICSADVDQDDTLDGFVQARQLWRDLDSESGADVDAVIRPYLRTAPPGRDGRG